MILTKKLSLLKTTLIELEKGNPVRPLSLPKDADVKTQMAQLRLTWQEAIQPHISSILTANNPTDQTLFLAQYRPKLEAICYWN